MASNRFLSSQVFRGGYVPTSNSTTSWCAVPCGGAGCGIAAWQRLGNKFNKPLQAAWGLRVQKSGLHGAPRRAGSRARIFFLLAWALDCLVEHTHTHTRTPYAASGELPATCASEALPQDCCLLFALKQSKRVGLNQARTGRLPPSHVSCWRLQSGQPAQSKRNRAGRFSSVCLSFSKRKRKNNTQQQLQR